MKIDKKEKILIMTVGLPYSGKSTWAKSMHYPIVCPDSIRLTIHGQRFRKSIESMVWAIAKIMVEALFEAGHDKVILDACSHTADRRNEWKNEDWTRWYVVCDISKIGCMARAQESGDLEIMPIIDRMAGVLDYEGILYGTRSLDTKDPHMIDHIKTPAGTRDDLQIFHEGHAADDI